MTSQTLGASAPSYLTFHESKLTIVDRNGQTWVTSSDIARALGYADDSAVGRIYRRHKGEFTEHMSTAVNLTEPDTCSGTPTNGESVRIFSLRGAHLIAMFARTPRAAEFRRWVLDLLDQETAKPQTQPRSTPALAQKSKIDDKKMSRINQHAWSLAHAYYESTRTQMIADINQGLHTAPVEDWKPPHAIDEVLESIEVMVVTARLHANAMRREGRKLAELAGADYDAATAGFPKID